MISYFRKINPGGCIGVDGVGVSEVGLTSVDGNLSEGISSGLNRWNRELLCCHIDNKKCLRLWD